MGLAVSKENDPDSPDTLVVRLPKEREANNRRHEDLEILSIAEVAKYRREWDLTHYTKKKKRDDAKQLTLLGFIGQGVVKGVQNLPENIGKLFQPKEEGDETDWKPLDPSSLTPEEKKLRAEQAKIAKKVKDWKRGIRPAAPVKKVAVEDENKEKDDDDDSSVASSLSKGMAADEEPGEKKEGEDTAAAGKSKDAAAEEPKQKDLDL